MKCKLKQDDPAKACTCNALPEHMGGGRYGKFHRQDCPQFDGDHPERCSKPTEKGDYVCDKCKGLIYCSCDDSTAIVTTTGEGK